MDAIKSKERERLKGELAGEEDEGRRRQIRYLIQRYDNQERERRRLEAREALKREERERNEARAMEGKGPVHASRREERNRELVARYEEMKGSGGLEKYLKKKGRRMEAKERKRAMKVAE